MEVKSTNQGPLPTTNSNPRTWVKSLDRKFEEDGNVKTEKLSDKDYDISSSHVEESKSDFKVSVQSNNNRSTKTKSLQSDCKSYETFPCFGSGSLEKPIVRFFFTSSCPPLGIDALLGIPHLAGRPSYLCQDGKFACSLCPLQLSSMAELVDHWRWEMEKEGMELLDEEEQEVPHAEVMPPMMEKVEVGECDDDLAQPDDLGFQRASGVDDTDIATYPDLSLKQEFVEGLAVNLQKTHKKRVLEGPRNCDQCSYTCEKQDTLRMHKFRKHSTKNEYDNDKEAAIICDECNYTCDKRDMLRRHKLRKHCERAYSSKTLTCDQCDYTCIRRDTLNTHKNRKHRGKGQKHVYCNECDYKCTKKETLSMHIYKQHNGPKPEAKQCDMCAFTCMTMSGLRHHKNYEHLGLTFNCPKCDFSSRNKWTLANHEQQLHGKEFAEGKNVMCHLCDYRTYAAANLRNHIEVKHSDRMYYCDKCDFKSPYKGSSNSHKKIHDEDSWFQCEYCEYRCAAKGNLETHMDGKHKDISKRSYPCPDCNHISRTKPDLNSHKAAVHLNIRHKCEVCDYSTASRQMVKKHFIARHTNIRFSCPHCVYTCNWVSDLQKHSKGQGSCGGPCGPLPPNPGKTCMVESKKFASGPS